MRLSRELADVDQELGTRGDEVPPTPPPPRPAVPLKKAIRLALGRYPELYAEEIMAVLTADRMEPGGKNPRNTLVSRLSEMIRDGEVERHGGRYRLLAPNTGPQGRLNEEEVPAM